MIIGLVRHGETAWNAVGRIQGQTDIPLNSSGLEQAERLAVRLQEEDFKWDYIVTSDLLRAVETGDAIAKLLEIPVLEPDMRLRERHFGQIEGLTKAEREAKWGTDMVFTDYGAETFEALQTRTIEFLNDLYVRYPHGHILCITHGGLISRILLHLFSGIEDRRIGNVSLSIIDYTPTNQMLTLHNCMKHNEQ